MDKKRASVPYDEVAKRIYKDDPQLAANVLNSCLEDGAIDEFLIALKQITKAYGGISNIAKAGGLHEKTLYKSLAQDGNPTIKTLLAVTNAMNMRLTFTPKNAA